MHIDHITIRTHELEKTRDFMVTIFNLVEGPRPAAIIANVVGYWLYEKNWPLIHLIQSPLPKENKQDQAEAIDHFAFVMEDYEAFKLKLKSLNIPFQKMHLPEMNRKRIFLRTPTAILIETIFEM